MGLRRTPIRGPCAVSVRSQRAQLASQVRDYAHTRDIRYPSLGIPDNGHALGDNILMFNDWELLGQTHVILQFIYQSMLVVEGDTASLQQSLMTMDALLSFFEDKKVCPYINPITN